MTATPEAIDALRFSRLRLFGKSAAHYKGAVEEPTYDMERGTAVHGLVFGNIQVVGWEEGRPRRGKDYDAFAADHPGALILTNSEYQTASAMAAAVQKNRLAKDILDGEYEQTMLWQRDGRWCRGTPDVRNDVRRFHAELKTGETADPRKFQWKLRDFCYHGQLAWYADGAELAGRPRPESHYIVAVEAAAPYVSTVFRVRHDAIEAGRRLITTWLEQLRACEASDAWPPYCESVVELALADDSGLIFEEAVA
jgi:hypothetical protein